MSITLFMLVIVALALGLLGTAGFLVYKLVTRPKPPKDFTGVETPPSFRDADEHIPPIVLRGSEREKSGERS